MSMPAPKEIRDLFADLLGRAIQVNLADPVGAAELRMLTLGVYVDDGLKLAAVIGMDLPLAAYSGAAIGLVPVATATACVEAGVMNPMIEENVVEVFNILASLVNKPGAPHVRMYQTFMPGDPAPADANSLIQAMGNRLDVTIDVHGYGAGKMSISYRT